MDLSRFVGVLSFIAALLTTTAAYLDTINPKYAVYALAASAAINAFTGRIQGKSGEKDK